MPLYEYTCQGCGTQFSARRSFADCELPAKCPKCGDEGRRALSRVVAFSTDSSGQRRAVAGSFSCSGCASAAVGCSGGCSLQ
ncbi:MAG: zinc ribbon domain-containing protein [Chloroflexi bacterium]|nr:zinc ribbon domain-containing protein [Chloroflexota bacterium]